MPKPPPKYVSLRQLAKRLDVSAAAISQGSLTSSQTLIALRSELAAQEAERAKAIKKGRGDL